MTTPNEIAERLDRAARDALASGEAPRIDYDTARQAADMLKRLSTTEAPEPLVERVDPVVEFRRFTVWVGNHLPGQVHTETSHLFDAWMASARAALSSSISNTDHLSFSHLDHNASVEVSSALADRVETSAITATEDSGEVVQADKARFDFLQGESYDLHSFAVPTGGDDADIGWRVVGHWIAEPQERTIAEVYHDDPRAAIDAAMALTPDQLREISHGNPRDHRLSALSQSPDSLVEAGEAVTMPPEGCLRCAPQWNSIEICDKCERKFLASLSKSPSAGERA